MPRPPVTKSSRGQAGSNRKRSATSGASGRGGSVASRGRASAGAATNKRSRTSKQAEAPIEIASRDDDDDDDDNETRDEDQEEDVEEEDGQDDDDDDEEEDKPATVPPELLTRLLHEFFTTDGTRITKDANSAVAKYMDVFVREAIARSAVERASGFLEVEDLEKVAPQLLLDL
ncbi:CENP-S associating centromere protein X-domain-containing protein [Lasiosphaeria ovina]|uniref:CENP-S associating centromere protein X-domain-containing protein n=1 Tax=Lasiosphaeria ovina TaxID=92902 RepID=A0AAE0K6N9_9PEZI|nr:CENP-S associating centromere protein X-domain-containing protein [Lasiosphaeria ovina]